MLNWVIHYTVLSAQQPNESCQVLLKDPFGRDNRWEVSNLTITSPYD